MTIDLVHRYYQNQVQISDGRNDNSPPRLTRRGSRWATATVEAAIGEDRRPLYTMADNFFQAAFGGSFLNHQWLIAARTPKFANAPNDGGSCDSHTVLDANGMPAAGHDGAPDDGGRRRLCRGQDPAAVPTPYKASCIDYKKRLPALNGCPIGDRLSGAGLNRTGTRAAAGTTVAGDPDPLFQFHRRRSRTSRITPQAHPAVRTCGTRKEFLAAAHAGRPTGSVVREADR